MTPVRIFIRSVQREFAEERAMLSSYIRGDALLGKFFETFVFEESPAQSAPTPEYRQDEDFRVVIFRPEIEGSDQGSESETQSEPQSEQSIKILHFCRTPHQAGEIRAELRYSNRTKFRKKYMTPLLADGLLAMTIPDKPTSSQQKYRTTAQGMQRLETCSKKLDNNKT